MSNLYGLRRTAAISLGAALCLVTMMENAAFAQSGGRSASSVGRRIEQLNRQSEQYERDKLSREVKGEADDPKERRRAQAVAAQVRHDFESLQTDYNRIVLAMASKEGFNYDSISGAVAEIKKCSTRLKDNLSLPRPKDAKEEEAGSNPATGQTEELLMTLRKHLYSFLTNPLFETPSVLDVEQAGKASRDLERVIELSKSLGKSGSQLKKPTKP
jgi:hypothetical protein